METLTWKKGYDDRIQQNNIQYLKDSTITEPTTKTVGVGKDFETLHEALRWAEMLAFSHEGTLILSLDDGTHVLGGDGELQDWEWAYYVFTNAKIRLLSASSNKANCIITQDPFDDGDNWAAMFCGYTTVLTFDSVTVDFAIGGYPYSEHTDLHWCYSSSTTTIQSSTIKNVGYGLLSYSSSSAQTTNTVFDNCEVGLSNYGGFLSASNAIISNNNMGVEASLSAGNYTTLNNPTFTSNTTDTNIPLNEIQYNGSYISDGTGALSFKA